MKFKIGDLVRVVKYDDNYWGKDSKRHHEKQYIELSRKICRISSFSDNSLIILDDNNEYITKIVKEGNNLFTESELQKVPTEIICSQ